MKKYYLLFWLLCCFNGLAQAQNRDITGTVKLGEKGETVPGVTVLVKGTTNGASTDLEGNYKVSVPAQADVTLRVSYLGYVTKEVKVGQGTTGNVTLAEDSKQLDDVVVIGFQAIERKDVTGSVTSVNAQQIKDIPVNSAAEALAGRLAGVQVTSAEGAPGADIRIQVRGGSSMTQDNSPLYVVDGVQVENALSVISPQDIASVDVLKDASSTAIYGARGANGVVIITTKNGKEGRTTVNYNAFYGVRKITRTLDVLQPADYLEYAFDRSAQSGSAGLNSFQSRYGTKGNNFYSDTLDKYKSAPFVDWQDRVFGRNAMYQTHNITVSGGGKGTTYSLSLTNNQEEGIQYSSGLVRNLVNFRFDNKANDKLRLGFNFRFNDQVISGAGTGTTSSLSGSNTNNPAPGTGSTTNSQLRNAVQYSPLNATLPSGLNPSDEVIDEASFVLAGSLINPLIALDNQYKRDRRRLFNTSAFVSYSFTKNLTFRTTAGIDNSNNRVELFYGAQSAFVRSFNRQPAVAINTLQPITFNNSNVLTYKFKKGEHHFDGVLGHELYLQSSQTLSVQTLYLPTGITAEKAINNINQGVLPSTTATQAPPTTGKPIDSRLLSGFGRFNYGYADRYLLALTFRADGSSKFAPGKQWGYFPAASAAWRISNESFMKSVTTVTDLKLRGSFGLSGNNRIGDFLYDTYFNPGSTQYALNHAVVYGPAPVSLANPDLKWETTTSSNLGLDFSLFSNRIQVSTDLYYSRTSDLLLKLNIPASSGYTTQLKNAGTTSNRGIETQITATIIRTPDFSWTANGNIAFNRNQVESLSGNTYPLQYSGWASTAISADYALLVGQPVGLMYGYVTDGYYTPADFEPYASKNAWVLKRGIANDGTIIGTAPAPGQLKLKSINGDTIVNDADRQVIGNANPKFTGGLSQQFTYKNFDASIFVNFVYGNQIWNDNKIEYTTYLANSQFSNGLSIMKDRYRTIDLATGKAITDAEALNALNKDAKIWAAPRQLVPHSWAIEDGSFLRINNISLGYSLPKALISRARITQLRVYATVNNVYTFTKYTGFDPEVNTRNALNTSGGSDNSTSSPSLTPGVDYAGYPRSRAYLVGVNVSF